MSDHVDELLRHWRRSAFVWGESDCLLSVGDYIASRGGADVASLYRGRYTTEGEALALMAAGGGPIGLIDATGMQRTDDPQRGDVILIDVASGIAGLHTGQGAAVRRERGLAEINFRLIRICAAWKIP